ncbi:MAG: hypothetical protein ABI476_04750, partial [Oxalobacteraceae bacterium]
GTDPACNAQDICGQDISDAQDLLAMFRSKTQTHKLHGANPDVNRPSACGAQAAALLHTLQKTRSIAKNAIIHAYIHCDFKKYNDQYIFKHERIPHYRVLRVFEAASNK